ncbi:MAG TPA: hypothetical protein VLA88_01995 [Candidatus Saccharimonadales bacterium]|nr:hypothetical protein [Candidatus Saccharimonadales bacterium]
MIRTVFVDFDRTLFNTELFQRLCWQEIGNAYNVDVEAAHAQMPAWYHQVGDLHYYSLDEQLAAMFTQDTPDEIMATIRPKLASMAFSYPDAKEVFAWQKAGYEVHIVTFGEEWFQNTKRSFVPELAELPFHITLEQKGSFIASNFPDATGFMIDDKRNLDLPPAIREVWLNRVDNKQEAGILTIHSLKAMEELL